MSGRKRRVPWECKLKQTKRFAKDGLQPDANADFVASGPTSNSLTLLQIGQDLRSTVDSSSLILNPIPHEELNAMLDQFFHKPSSVQEQELIQLEHIFESTVLEPTVLLKLSRFLNVLEAQHIQLWPGTVRVQY